VRAPLPYRLVDRRIETTDTVTLTLEPTGSGIGPWRPGQFTMVYAFGVGEVPISISGGNGTQIWHTVRDVGAVTHAIASAPVGSVLGLHGPYGQGWDLDSATGGDLVVLGGGIGLAPVRPLIVDALARQHRYGRVVVLVGARQPADLIFTHEYGAWRAAGAQLLVTVDRADAGWRGPVGVVTTLLSRARFAAGRAVAFVCGPEVMMRFAARDLIYLGVPAAAVRVSLERNMRCGVARCGHCQLGPLMLCRDGPVVDWHRAAPLLSVKEL
jgi:anaerobic sulfite reductase subunit B